MTTTNRVIIVEGEAELDLTLIESHTIHELWSILTNASVRPQWISWVLDDVKIIYPLQQEREQPKTPRAVAALVDKITAE